MSTSTQYDYTVAMLSDRAMEIMTNNGGRGHNSYKEAYARMKAPIEDIEAFIKQIKKYTLMCGWRQKQTMRMNLQC